MFEVKGGKGGKGREGRREGKGNLLIQGFCFVKTRLLTCLLGSQKMKMRGFILVRG